MKRLLTVLLLLACQPAWAVGFQWAKAPDPGHPDLEVAIWYPSAAKTAMKTIGPFDMDVADGGQPQSGKHALIVMSHGTGGMALNSFDTAMAFAKAGFVVVAVTHTGDNYRDQSVAFTRTNFVNRPEQVSRVIDYMLTLWSGHDTIDPKRIGLFGHSAGGATALIAAGGIADMTKVLAFCQGNPADWGCTEARQRPVVPDPAVATPVAAPEPRIRAIVIAAPALAVVFAPDGLSRVNVPVQLWAGARDVIVPDAPLIRKLLPKQPDYHLVPNGGHFAFLAPCSDILAKAAPEICEDPKGFDRKRFLAGFQRSTIAFFQSHLK
jgi:predicted dienelactone hydrolase